MIEEFDRERLGRRRAFLESRAAAHVGDETGQRRWHLAAAATLLRDTAAVALFQDDFRGARRLLRESGDLFLQLGFAGGLQLHYIAGELDGDTKERPIDEHRIDSFARAFDDQRQGKKAPTAQDIAQDLEQVFVADSFRPPQLLRLYQALAGRRDDDRDRHGLRMDIRTTLKVNATMPVGAARMSLGTYLATLDRLARRDEEAAPPGGVDQVLGALAQRREELLNAARQDRFHWHALIRPAELVDFDLLALVLAGVRRGGPSYLAAEAFAKRDPLTALPVHAAEALQ